MNSSDRMKAVLFIWGAVGFAAGFSFVGDATSINDIFLALIFAIAAVLATGMVMRGAPLEERVVMQDFDKAKRGTSNLYDMLNDLDDEELRALRQRLMMDSDNSIPLNQLMSREKQERR